MIQLKMAVLVVDHDRGTRFTGIAVEYHFRHTFRREKHVTTYLGGGFKYF